MNKNDLIASVASSAGLSKSDSTRALESLLDTITNALKRGEKVSIVGFGNFTVNERKATVGRNPRTGETIQIPASKRPKFSVGKALKDAVNV
mgnify:FL=1